MPDSILSHKQTTLSFAISGAYLVMYGKYNLWGRVRLSRNHWDQSSKPLIVLQLYFDVALKITQGSMLGMQARQVDCRKLLQFISLIFNIVSFS